jgi:hypothetical protein
MGRLKPGATYIYEKANGVTYAREFGAPHNERFEIGRDYDRKKQDDLDFWKDLLEASEGNPTLQQALERAKIIYHLSKENGNGET